MKKGMTLLFQGDSITDGGRKRSMDGNNILGHGYPYLISAELSIEYCEKQLKFINKGVTGEAIENIYARLERDVIAYKPDLVSFLAGINDIERGVTLPYGETTGNYIAVYLKMYDRLKAALPDTVVVICEPFYLEVDNYDAPYENTPYVRCEEYFQPLNFPKNEKLIQRKKQEIALMQEKLREMADACDCIYVPLQEEFDSYAGRVPAEYLIWDNIHPTVAGHELIARKWLRTVKAATGKGIL